MGDRRDKFETQVYLKPETARLLEKAEERWREYDKEINKGENRFILKNGKTDRDAVIRRALKEHVGEDEI